MGTGVGAQDLTTKLLSSPDTASRDPVISESGLVAWIYADTNVLKQGRTHVAIHRSDENVSDTDVFPGLTIGSKVQIHENKFTFTAGAIRKVTKRNQSSGSFTNTAGSALENENKTDGEIAITDIGVRAATSEGEGSDTDPMKIGKTATEAYNEVYIWDRSVNGVRRVPGDGKAGFAPHLWGNTAVWQEEQEWPFGYEIVALFDGALVQLTTNNYYELAPRAYENRLVWYGWDGNDYEIFFYDRAVGQVSQITSNLYDDIVPQISEAAIIWEAYPGVEGDIYMFKDGSITNISGGIEDDINPRLWKDKVVWQGFDGDDFEIYLYDISKGGSALKLTSNSFDDTNPEIGSELVAWMGYHDNWDSEIFFTDIRSVSSTADVKIIQLTNNELDDTDPKTAGPRIVWVSDETGLPQIMLAEPR